MLREILKQLSHVDNLIVKTWSLEVLSISEMKSMSSLLSKLVRHLSNYQMFVIISWRGCYQQNDWCLSAIPNSFRLTEVQ